MSEERDAIPQKPLTHAILTDVHFWVPFGVLLFGVVVLVICARA